MLQNLIQLRRVGLALAGLHREADEEAEQLVLAAAVLREPSRGWGLETSPPKPARARGTPAARKSVSGFSWAPR